MSTDKEISKFLSEIPIGKISQKTYTVDEAKSIYRENYRERIYSELKLEHIQKKIRNKILNRKCDADKDILFKKISIEQEIELNNISGLLSGTDFVDDSLKMTQKSEPSEERDERDEGDEGDEGDENINLSSKANVKTSKYLDLEAEQSSEDLEEEEDDGSDISSIVDDQQADENTAAEIYAVQKQEQDLKVLKDLVKKFKKKKKQKMKEIEQREFENCSTEEEEAFSEIPIEEIEVKRETISFEGPKEESLKNVQTSSVMFRNLEDATEKLNKKKKFTF